MPLQVDFVIANRFRVVRPLGEGGMGAAHLVEDQRLGRECVIKEVLTPDTLSYERIEREAQILAQLKHAHLPVVHDLIFEGKSPYLVMEYVQGTTLDRLQQARSAPFETAEVLKWARDLLDALCYLHEHDPPVIHRDIKPSNICITRAGEAVLLDFGIARSLDESKTHVAAQAVTKGYAPIEQYSEQDVKIYQKIEQYWLALQNKNIHTGPYSDIYGLGATLYYALTLLEVAPAPMRVLVDELQPVQDRNSEVPDYLAQAVMKALALHPEDRYQSAQEMLAALQPETQPEPAVVLHPRRPRPLPSGNVTVLDQELRYISAGEFLLGSNDPTIKEACRPQHTVSLGAFCIARHPVTNAAYKRFIDEQDEDEVTIPYSPLRVAQPYNWDRRTRTFPRGLEDHPVVLISWAEALAYCRWLSEVTGYRCRLPSEAEWEKGAAWDAATGQARVYPWGTAFSDERCNVDAHGALRLAASPVGRYSPAGDSPYGLVDMAGNVWEWTGSLYRPYPYEPGDGREDLEANDNRVVRGGAFDEPPSLARCAWRNSVQPELQLHNIGFRIVCEAR